MFLLNYFSFYTCKSSVSLVSGKKREQRLSRCIRFVNVFCFFTIIIFKKLENCDNIRPRSLTVRELINDVGYSLFSVVYEAERLGFGSQALGLINTITKTKLDRIKLVAGICVIIIIFLFSVR